MSKVKSKKGEKVPKINKAITTVTITFGEQSENHPGMKINGKGIGEYGIDVDDMEKIGQAFADKGKNVIIHYLHNYLKGDYRPEKAALLIVRNALNDEEADDILDEQIGLSKKWDRQTYMRGRVVNARARFNVCYGKEYEEPDYENKKGTIVPWSDVPVTKKLKNGLEKILKPYIPCESLEGEGNCYYDYRKCGIGFHGDAERKVVVGVRFGRSMPLHFQWYQNHEAVGKRMIFPLHHGDLYIMSEKTTGYDWKKTKDDLLTLRHATGEKYTK